MDDGRPPCRGSCLDVAASGIGRAIGVAEPAAVPRIELSDISHAFPSAEGAPVAAVDDIDLAIPEKAFVSLLGPSGCGKSTIFNIIAGLIAPSQGKVLLAARDITGMVGFVGYMLQKDMLLPWRTVVDNVIIGMELQGVPKAQARACAMPYLARYGLAGFEHRYPAVLSGGMRQRAALLRTLLYDSDVILLDEPFGALDAQTRAHMQDWLLQIWADFDKTVVFITHDIEEAVLLSDSVIVMSARPGHVKEIIDVPLERPRSRAVSSDPRFLEIKRRCSALLAGEHGTADVEPEAHVTAGAGATSIGDRAGAAALDLPAGRPVGIRPRGRILREQQPWPAWAIALSQIGIVLAIIVLWEIAARRMWIDPFFWSQPSKIADTFSRFVGSGAALSDTLFTLRATILGFILGTLTGALIGLSFWWSRNYAAIARPFLVCVEAIPKLALAPLIVLVFGIGLASKVALSVALTLVVTTLTTYTAVSATDRDAERMLYSLGASRRQVFSKLVIPATLPWIVSCLRVNIGLSLTGAVIGEFISSQQGLGRQILYAGQVFDIALIWVAVSILSTLSIIMYVLVGHLETFLLKGLRHGSQPSRAAV